MAPGLQRPQTTASQNVQQRLSEHMSPVDAAASRLLKATPSCNNNNKPLTRTHARKLTHAKAKSMIDSGTTDYLFRPIVCKPFALRAFNSLPDAATTKKLCKSFCFIRLSFVLSSGSQETKCVWRVSTTARGESSEKEEGEFREKKTEESFERERESFLDESGCNERTLCYFRYSFLLLVDGCANFIMA